MFQFEVGDRVRKVKGYKFEGTVRAVFTVASGETRIVVEHADGWAHIFNPQQMESMDL